MNIILLKKSGRKDAMNKILMEIFWRIDAAKIIVRKNSERTDVTNIVCE
jgi:hypothetical protein